MTQKEKMIIYQVFPRLFGNLTEHPINNGDIKENGVGKFSDFTPQVLAKIKELSITHVWYTGVIEHATQTDYRAHKIAKDHNDVVKGIAGSPYAIKDYYDIDPDLADHIPDRMAEFEALIERTHRAGMKVIIDFVPNHVARQYASDARLPYVVDLGQKDNTDKAFSPNNNFYYIPGHTLTLHFGAQQEDFEYGEFPAKVTGNNCFTAAPGKNDWYETVKLNYGVDYQGGGTCHFNPRPNTWNKMLDILLFWADKGVDGFRCDMAEMVPVEFWSWVIPEVKKRHSGLLFIAEVYNPDEYRNYIHNGRFDFLYDKVGLYDTLREVMCGHGWASRISHCWQSLNGIQHQMLNFLENHDEQRIASTFFAGDARKGFPAMIVASAMNVNPVMIYSGQELGEEGMDEEGFSGCDGRTTIFDYWSVKSIRNWINNGKMDGGKLTQKQKQLRESYLKLLHIVRNEPVIVNGEFFDLMYANASNPYLNDHRQYAFLRKYQHEVLLAVVNFDKAEQTVRLEIPADAFKTLGFSDNRAATMTDLLTGESCISTLTDAYPYQVTIPAYSGKLLKFTYRE